LSAYLIGLVNLGLLHAVLITGILPLKLRYAILDTVSILFFLALGSKRRAVRNNLKLVTGKKAPLRDVAQVFIEYGRYWAELPAISSLWKNTPRDYIGDPPPGENGCIMMTLHVGNFEVFAEDVYQRTGRELPAIVEHLKPEFLTRCFRKIRARHHSVPILHDDLRAMVRALRQGKSLGIIGDRVISGEGMEVEILGVKVSLPFNFLRFGLRNNFPLYAGFCVKSKGRLKIAYHKIPDRISLEEAVAYMAAFFETTIKQYPTQWHFLSEWKKA
jgi:KDO2-lipid IV(A) lauroyltransferase